jgi:hypothetical protein
VDEHPVVAGLSDFCIIAAEPFNVSDPNGARDLPEQIAAKEREFCLWVRLPKNY